MKAYYGRFYNQFGSEFAESVNPNARINVQVPWNDREQQPEARSRRAEPDELHRLHRRVPADGWRCDPAVQRRIQRRRRSPAVRDFAVSASYHRRQHRNGLGIVDLARPASAYTRGHADLHRSAARRAVHYRLQPRPDARDAARSGHHQCGRASRATTTACSSVSTSACRTAGRCWAALTLQKHEGFDHSGTFTSPATNTDMNNPNYRSTARSAIFTESRGRSLYRAVTSCRTTYVSGKYTARDGEPLKRTITLPVCPQVTRPSGCSRAASTAPRRLPNSSTCASERFSRTARVSKAFDIFNLLNANHVLEQTEGIGTTSAAARILTPRIIRVGFGVNF